MFVGLMITFPIAAARLFAQPDQLQRIRHGERFQQDCVNQRKNGSGGADPQRERQNHCEGRAGADRNLRSA